MLEPHLKSQSQQVIANVYRYFSEEQDNGGPLCSLSEVYKRVAAATGVGLRSIQTLNAKCKRGQALFTPGKRRPNSQRRVIAVDDLTKCKIRQIVYDLNTAGSNFTLNRILSTIRDNGVAFEGGRTSLGTLLKEMSMKWLKANNRRLVLEHRDTVAARRQYLRRLKENRESVTPRPVVYLDETWINLKQTPKSDVKKEASVEKDEDESSVLEEETGNDVQKDTKLKTKPNKLSSKKADISTTAEVKRYMIINAGNENGFVEGAGQILSGGRRCVTEDVNGEQFEKWFTNKLLPSLPSGSIVVMDNAWYHNMEVDKPPSVISTKTEIVTWLQKNGVCCTSDMIKAELLQLVNQHRPAKRYKVDELLEKSGHSSLRLPPHHCDLNPCEQIFAQAKTYFNKKNTHRGVCNDRFANALWTEALMTVTLDNWADAMRHVKTLEEDYWSKDCVLDGLVERLAFQGCELSSDDSDSNVSDIGQPLSKNL